MFAFRICSQKRITGFKVLDAETVQQKRQSVGEAALCKRRIELSVHKYCKAFPSPRDRNCPDWAAFYKNLCGL